MGSGFAFVAQQKHFEVGDSDFYVDLILYNIQLHAYVVVELKAAPFKPEYMGQLNFYINVVDDTLYVVNTTIRLSVCFFAMVEIKSWQNMLYRVITTQSA